MHLFGMRHDAGPLPSIGVKMFCPVRDLFRCDDCWALALKPALDANGVGRIVYKGTSGGWRSAPRRKAVGQ
jgi:hypothetical protein